MRGSRKAVEGADVFLDTAVRFMEGDKNTMQDQRKFANDLFALLRAGARSVIGLHHAPKNALSKATEMTLDNVLRGSGDIGAMAATVWGFDKVDPVNSTVYVSNVKDRDFTDAPKPFVIQGKPHLDNEGKFKLLHAPGEAPEYRSFKQSARGKQGGRPKNELPNSLAMQAAKLLDAGQSRQKGCRRAEGVEVHYDACH